MNDLSSDRLWTRKEIDSPCVKICVIHPAVGLCVGCRRTLDEISNWSAMSSEGRAAITAQLPGREALLTQRRGGRSARVQQG